MRRGHNLPPLSPEDQELNRGYLRKMLEIQTARWNRAQSSPTAELETLGLTRSLEIMGSTSEIAQLKDLLNKLGDLGQNS